MTLPRWGRRVLVGIGFAIVASVAGAAGCGPIEYVNQVTRRADSAVEAARTVEAAKYSPYWWTRAVEYLHKARDEAAHADFQAANRFGRLAEEAAIAARDEAIKRASDPEAMRELELPPEPAPAQGGGGLAPVGDDDGSSDDDEPPLAPTGDDR